MAVYSFLLSLLPSKILSPSEGGGDKLALKQDPCQYFCPPELAHHMENGLRLKTCLSVTVYPNMMESFKFRSVYKHHMCCPIANCILVGHNNR